MGCKAGHVGCEDGRGSIVHEIRQMSDAELAKCIKFHEYHLGLLEEEEQERQLKGEARGC